MTETTDDLNKKLTEAQNALLDDFKNHLTSAVETQIKVTVNGQITALRLETNEGLTRINGRLDKQDIILNRLDTDTKPLIQTKTWTIDFIKGLKSAAIWITAIGGAYLVLTNIFK